MFFTSMNTIKNIFPVFQKLSLCYNKIPCVFPVWKKLDPNSLVSLCRGHPGIASYGNDHSMPSLLCKRSFLHAN